MRRMENEAEKNGVIGDFSGWRIGGKSYDPDGNEIVEVHEPDCFCCRENLLTTPLLGVDENI